MRKMMTSATFVVALAAAIAGVATTADTAGDQTPQALKQYCC